MKRIGGLFDSILDRDNLQLAFFKACRRKRDRTACPETYHDFPRSKSTTQHPRT